jgi:hypothetical protein
MLPKTSGSAAFSEEDVSGGRHHHQHNHAQQSVIPNTSSLLKPHRSLSSKRKITIAVFTAGLNNTEAMFRAALGEYSNKHLERFEIIPEFISNKDIRENKCRRFTAPSDLIRWLMSKTAYFIVSQGIWLGMVTSGISKDGWNVEEIEQQMKILEASGRIGYPSGPQLHCPIWNGDKVKYINLIPEFAIPTLQLKLIREDQLDGKYLREIYW